MISMEESQYINVLSVSFSKQLQWYEELSHINQKTLSQLILSRGDMAPVLASARKKRSIMEKITEEREKIKDIAEIYQKNKDAMKSMPFKNDLENVLSQSESAIKSFLDGENQLKRHLEFLMEKTHLQGG